MYKELNKQIVDGVLTEPTELQVGSFYAVIYTDSNPYVLYLTKVLSKKVSKVNTEYTFDEINVLNLDTAKIKWSSQFTPYSYIQVNEQMFLELKELAQEKQKIDAEYTFKTNAILKSNNNLKHFEL
jgi:hypothetical protein